MVVVVLIIMMVVLIGAGLSGTSRLAGDHRLRRRGLARPPIVE